MLAPTLRRMPIFMPSVRTGKEGKVASVRPRSPRATLRPKAFPLQRGKHHTFNNVQELAVYAAQYTTHTTTTNAP